MKKWNFNMIFIKNMEKKGKNGNKYGIEDYVFCSWNNS